MATAQSFVSDQFVLVVHDARPFELHVASLAAAETLDRDELGRALLVNGIRLSAIDSVRAIAGAEAGGNLERPVMFELNSGGNVEALWFNRRPRTEWAATRAKLIERARCVSV